MFGVPQPPKQKASAGKGPPFRKRCRSDLQDALSSWVVESSLPFNIFSGQCTCRMACKRSPWKDSLVKLQQRELLVHVPRTTPNQRACMSHITRPADCSLQQVLPKRSCRPWKELHTLPVYVRYSSPTGQAKLKSAKGGSGVERNVL